MKQKGARNINGGFFINKCEDCPAMHKCSVGMDFDQPRSNELLQAELDQIISEDHFEETEIEDTPENREAFKSILKEIRNSNKEEDEQ
jgi:hypothetical protein